MRLLVGPARAGKVALLLERYLARLDDDPYLVVPNRGDVDRVERDLLGRCGCLLSGTIGTFDDLFELLVADDPERRPVIGPAQRWLVVARALGSTELDGLGRSARTAGFGEALAAALGELESGLLEPADLDGELGSLYAAYRSELDALGLWDRDLLRRRAVERLAGELDAWDGRPVLAYGFEDLTAAEWSLLEALAGRAELEVSLPYEPGRVAFASLRRTAEDLAALAAGNVDELPAAAHLYAPPALAHIERRLFEGPVAEAPSLDGAVRLLEGAGVRGTLELVAQEIVALLRSGTPAERIGVICPSVEPWRAPLETVLGTLGVPYAVEGRARLGSTPFGHALLQLLRYAWRGGGRRELYGFLRSPYSGLSRASVDYVEGRLRGRAVSEPERVEAETERLREGTLPMLEELRSAGSPLAAVAALAHTMLAAAYGLDAPPAGDGSRADLRAYDAVVRLLEELGRWEELAAPVAEHEVLLALERTDTTVPRGEPGRVAVLDLLRARTRDFDAVFVLGLEEGVLPRRGSGSPFLDDDTRRELGSRLERPEQVSRDRYLFYTVCTRASRRLHLVREAATDDGTPREPSPFWEEVVSLFDPAEVERVRLRRPLSALTWALEDAPSERERLRALAQLAVRDPDEAISLAESNGWERRLARARGASRRRTRLESPIVLEWLGARTTFGVTELERFADCSSAWLVERVVDPKKIDAQADAMLRGSVAHQTLFKFYGGLPKEVGADRVTAENLEPALRYLAACLDEAIAGGVRLELAEVDALELRAGLWRDLEGFLRDEAASEVGLLPRKLEIGFGSERSAPELQRGLELGEGLFLSGKIDRIDVDPFSARGIVQDYKSGKNAHSAKQIDEELKLQVPLYLLVLRDLVGVEPLGGVYRALGGSRQTRGLLRVGSAEDLPGFAKADYLEEDAFWVAVESARDRAADYARRIRAGDVRHDPKSGSCPTWCGAWPICRVERA